MKIHYTGNAKNVSPFVHDLMKEYERLIEQRFPLGMHGLSVDEYRRQISLAIQDAAYLIDPSDEGNKFIGRVPLEFEARFKAWEKVNPGDCTRERFNKACDDLGMDMKVPSRWIQSRESRAA